MEVDSANEDGMMSPPTRRPRRTTSKPELVIKAKSKRKTMGGRRKLPSSQETDTESEAEKTPKKAARKVPDKKENKENLGGKR